MINMIVSLLKGIVSLLKIPIILLFIVFVVFMILYFINIAILYKQGYRFIKGSYVKQKKPSMLKRLFIMAPRQYALDTITRDPDFFKYQGCIIFVGRQGRGKTVSMVEFMRRMQLEYPKAKCITNLNYKYQDQALGHWKDLLDYKNGKQGVIVGMDETQNWFSSSNSKNFPPEMLSVITQNRKNRRIILGTAQSFHLLAKAIRTQATEIRECVTILGCITFVRRREPILDSEGNVVEYKNRGIYFFVHNKEIRESYDTYSVISALSEVGFIDKDYLVENGVVVNVPQT